MGVVLAAGGSFQWFRNELGKAEIEMARQRGEDPYFLLTDEAALAGPGAGDCFSCHICRANERLILILTPREHGLA